MDSCGSIQASLDRLARSAANGIFATTVLVAAALAILGGSILGLFGDAFVVAHTPMMILVGGQVAWAAMAPASIILNMSGHQNASAKILAGAAALNGLLCIVLAPAYGATGAAVATAIATVYWNVMMVLALKRLLRVRAYIDPTGFGNFTRPG